MDSVERRSLKLTNVVLTDNYRQGKQRSIKTGYDYERCLRGCRTSQVRSDWYQARFIVTFSLSVIHLVH